LKKRPEKHNGHRKTKKDTRPSKESEDSSGGVRIGKAEATTQLWEQLFDKGGRQKKKQKTETKRKETGSKRTPQRHSSEKSRGPRRGLGTGRTRGAVPNNDQIKRGGKKGKRKCSLAEFYNEVEA